MRLKVIIDRVEKNRLNQIQIVDYKTGKDDVPPIHEIEDLFHSDPKKKHNSVALQVFMYCLVYEMEHGVKDAVPHIISLRKLFNDQESRNLKWSNKTEIYHFSELFDEYKKYFTTCVEEIFDPNKPFTQAINPDSCLYCPVKTICKK